MAAFPARLHGAADVRVIGLMSGTSLDGIDAAIVRFEGGEADLEWRLEAFHTRPFDAAARDRIHAAIRGGDARTLCRLNVDLGEWLASAALEVCANAAITPSAVDLIGSHGQTIWHEPRSRERRGATLQLGCAATIAERTGIDVVSDFRARDVAAGGEGAPLVPFADRLLYAVPGRTRILLNIGGMANLTRVPPRGDPAPLIAFDTGPGNALIDAAVELATGGRETFDRDGARARSGVIDDARLDRLRGDEWFERPPPKSTGREKFGLAFVRQLADGIAPADEAAWSGLIAVLTALTAATVADAIARRVPSARGDDLVVTGGGARNPVLVGALRQRLPQLNVLTGPEAGIDADAKEAIAFAALAWAHRRGIPGNVPEVTGADGPRILGNCTPARSHAPTSDGTTRAS
jgi:anhydro-N-acetylmuramic acid kinase